MAGRLDAVTVVDGQDVQDLLPAVDPAGRVRAILPPFDRCQVEHFERGLLGREMTPMLYRFAESRVQRLDAVGIGYDIFGRFGPVAAGNLGFGWSGSGRLEESARAGRSTP